MPEKYKIPYQNLEIDRPGDNEFVRWNDPANPNIKYFALRKGNQLYQSAINPLGDIPDEAAFKSKYGIDFGSLSKASGSLGDWVSTGLQTANWNDDILKGWTPPTSAGGVVTRTVDPNNPHGAIDVMGEVPASQAAPENYLQKLLGSGQGAGGSYSAPNTASPTGKGQTTIDKPYFKYENANEVYDSRTGQHITAEEAAKIPDFWSQVEKVSPGASVSYGGANASPGANQSEKTGGVFDSSDPRAVLANTLKEQGEMMQKYFDTLKAQPTAMDLFKQYSEQLGISSKSAQQTGLLSQVNKTEQMLDNLEKNISTRITELGEGMSEAQRSRQYATERRPIYDEYTKLVKAYNEGETSLSEARKQLGELMKYAQSDQEKAASLAYAPLEYSQKMLPTMLSVAEYQSPSERLAALISEEKAKKAEGLGNYYSKPTTKQTGSTPTIKDDPLDKQLSASDLKTYNDLYGVTFPPGTTTRQANNIIMQSQQPKEYTDEELREIARANQSANTNYEEAIAGIDTDTTIANKDRAKLITAEIYGKKTSQENKNEPDTGIIGSIVNWTNPLVDLLFGNK